MPTHLPLSFVSGCKKYTRYLNHFSISIDGPVLLLRGAELAECFFVAVAQLFKDITTK
jgi:hypothetical protein